MPTPLPLAPSGLSYKVNKRSTGWTLNFGDQLACCRNCIVMLSELRLSHVEGTYRSHLPSALSEV